jgi:23S rRNA (guanine745-N1)-methyltransferase
VSKPALRRAARAHPRGAAVACDAWGPLPLRDHAAAAVLNVFAPRNAAEIARVLRPDGAAVIVTPSASHLQELVAPLGLVRVDPDKEERLARQLATTLEPVEREELRWRIRLDGARAAAAMGPSAFHVAADELDRRVARLPDQVDVTAAVRLSLARAAARRARPRAPEAAASDPARRRSQPGSRPPRSPGGTG